MAQRELSIFLLARFFLHIRRQLSVESFQDTMLEL